MANKNGKQKSKPSDLKIVSDSLPIDDSVNDVIVDTMVDVKNVEESLPKVKNVEETTITNIDPKPKVQSGGKKTKSVVESVPSTLSDVPQQTDNIEPNQLTANVVVSKNKVIKTGVKQVATSGEKESPVVKGKGKGKGKRNSKQETDTKIDNPNPVPKSKPKKKQIVNENENDNDDDSTEKKNRSFKVKLPNKEDFEGRFTGLTPYQAANKALSKYFRETPDPLTEITFSICESTRKSKKTTYTYIGKRQKLDVPVSYTIQDGRQITKNFKNFLKKIKKNDIVE